MRNRAGGPPLPAGLVLLSKVAQHLNWAWFFFFFFGLLDSLATELSGRVTGGSWMATDLTEIGLEPGENEVTVWVQKKAPAKNEI